MRVFIFAINPCRLTVAKRVAATANTLANIPAHHQSRRLAATNHWTKARWAMAMQIPLYSDIDLVRQTAVVAQTNRRAHCQMAQPMRRQSAALILQPVDECGNGSLMHKAALHRRANRQVSVATRLNRQIQRCYSSCVDGVCPLAHRCGLLFVGLNAQSLDSIARITQIG